MPCGNKAAARSAVLLTIAFACMSATQSCRRDPLSAIPRRAALASSDLHFEDVTHASGLKFSRFNGAFGKRWMPETFGGGGAFIDYDNDGLLDILLIDGNAWPGHKKPGGKSSIVLYHNLGNGKFAEVTDAMGLSCSVQGMGVAVGDYDNDGWDDFVVTTVGGNRLFHNRNGKRFEDVTERSGIRGNGWSTSAAWLDYDNDGRLDLFVCHYVKWSPDTDIYCGATEKTYCQPQDYQGESCRLYHNEGNGRFRDTTVDTGIESEASKALGVTVCDINADGRPDIVVANDMEPNFEFVNKGGKFSEVALESGLALDTSGKPRGGMGIDSAANPTDGFLDVAIGNFYSQGVALFRQGSSGAFNDVAKGTGVFAPSYPYVTFGLFFCDLNNDGWQDLFITNGHIYDNVKRMDPSQNHAQPCTLLVNERGKYSDVTSGAGADLLRSIVGRGACWGDFDNDGRIDVLLVPNTGEARLLQNRLASKRHWLGIRLVGVRSNRNGFGAVVTVKTSSLSQTMYAHDGSSYLSDSDHRLHFGLADQSTIDRIEVRWPSGLSESWGARQADAYIKLVEGSGRSLTNSASAVK